MNESIPPAMNAVAVAAGDKPRTLLYSSAGMKRKTRVRPSVTTVTKDTMTKDTGRSSQFLLNKFLPNFAAGYTKQTATIVSNMGQSGSDCPMGLTKYAVNMTA